jgi:DNA (cytosine-5)-methyltransferase 1
MTALLQHRSFRDDYELGTIPPPPNFIDDVEATLPPYGSPQLRELIVVDLFCGAGGASQGLLRALARLGLTASVLRERGWTLRLINVNHWEVAIETIRTNIAFAEMYNASIENVDPTFVLKGARPHLLIAASECIMFSQARGNKAIRDQSRTTAAWILDWVDTNPHTLYFENVPEWRTWGPLDDSMRPLPDSKGEFYQAFLSAIRARDYDLVEDVVNCADHGDPTTRKRLFILGRKKNVASSATRRIAMPPATHTRFPERFPHLSPWVPARAIIDWNRRGEPITHRERGPHAVPTLRRIRAGYAKQEAALRPMLLELLDRLIPIAESFHKTLEGRHSDKKLGRKLTKSEVSHNSHLLKTARVAAAAAVDEAYKAPLGYVNKEDLNLDQQQALALILGQHGGAVARTEGEPIPTIAGSGAIGLATDSLLVKANASETSCFDDATQSLNKPLSTVVTKDCRALASPTLAVVQHGANDIRSPDINRPLPTITGKNSTGLADPVIAQLYSSNVEAGGTDPVSDPLSTITAGGIHHALAEPVIATVHGMKTEEDNRCRTTESPLSTVTSRPQHALANPVIATIYGSRGENDDDGRCETTDKTIGTVVAGGKHHALAEPTLVMQKGASTARSIDDPAPTLTAQVKHLAVAEPFIVPQQSVAEPRSVDLPTPTATSIARIGLAEARVTSNHYENAGSSVDEPAPTLTTGSAIGLTEPFIVPNFGERGTQQPRTHSINAPAPTITSHGAGALVDMIVPTSGPHFIYDGVAIYLNILYRMLHSSELARAHSFGAVHFTGSEQDAVKQIGNSIPVETAAAMIGHVLLPVLSMFEELELAA